jgi:3-oxoacyl-[acyl-carrier-protein] synthase II
LKRRVVVTGLGVVSPIGTGVEKFWKNLVAGVSGVDIIKRFDPVEIGLSVHIAAEVKDFNPELYFDKKEAQKVSDFIKFAVASAEEAIKDSGLLEDKFDPYRVGVIIGTGIGGLRDIEEQQKVLMEKGSQKGISFLYSLWHIQYGKWAHSHSLWV